MTNTKRYSDVELEEFRVLIQGKLDQSKEHLEKLQSQIFEIAENSDDEYGSDWMDDSSINNDIEILNDMAIRQRKHIQDLENALVRIKNKTYGICVVTGELIDKKRLLAVPTTTKSIAAKHQEAEKQVPKPTPSNSSISLGDADEAETEAPPAPKKSKPATPVIIEKISRKSSNAAPSKKSAAKEEDEDDFDLYKDLEIGDEENFNDDDLLDPDTIAEEPTEPEEDY